MLIAFQLFIIVISVGMAFRTCDVVWSIKRTWTAVNRHGKPHTALWTNCYQIPLSCFTTVEHSYLLSRFVDTLQPFVETKTSSGRRSFSFTGQSLIGRLRPIVARSPFRLLIYQAPTKLNS